MILEFYYNEAELSDKISERLVSYGNIKKPMSVTKLGTILSIAGYKAVRKRIANIQTRGWLVYQ